MQVQANLMSVNIEIVFQIVCGDGNGVLGRQYFGGSFVVLKPHKVNLALLGRMCCGKTKPS